MSIKVILTGSTGMVGEGVLMECLENPQVCEVLIVNRRPSLERAHPKLKECVMPDFSQLDDIEQFKNYDACFYCAGKSSVGMNEADYTKLTYDTVMAFAQKLLLVNPDMSFVHLTGNGTDSSETGKLMWANVKGKAENALMRLGFKAVYNFRPAMMKPTRGQTRLKGYNKLYSFVYPLFALFLPKLSCTVKEVGQAMIYCATSGYHKQILEVEDIKQCAKGSVL